MQRGIWIFSSQSVYKSVTERQEDSLFPNTQVRNNNILSMESWKSQRRSLTKDQTLDPCGQALHKSFPKKKSSTVISGIVVSVLYQQCCLSPRSSEQSTSTVDDLLLALPACHSLPFTSLFHQCCPRQLQEGSSVVPYHPNSALLPLHLGFSYPSQRGQHLTLGICQQKVQLTCDRS